MAAIMTFNKPRTNTDLWSATETIAWNWAGNFDELTSTNVKVRLGAWTMYNATKPAHEYRVRIGGTYDTVDGTLVATLSWDVPPAGGGPMDVEATIARPAGLQWVKVGIYVASGSFTNYTDGYLLTVEEA